MRTALASRRELPHPAMAMIPLQVVRIFDLMRVAEDEIERVKKGQTPEVAARVHAAFGILYPTPELGYDCNPKVYAAHCRELLERVVAGESDSKINLRTRPEVMMLLSRASLKSPLTTDGCDLYAAIFREIFGNAPGILRVEVRDQRAVDEMVDEFRRLGLGRKSRRVDS